MNIRLKLMILGLLFGNSMLIQAVADQDNDQDDAEQIPWVFIDEVPGMQMQHQGNGQTGLQGDSGMSTADLQGREALHRYDHMLDLADEVIRPQANYHNGSVDKLLYALALIINDSDSVHGASRFLDKKISYHCPPVGQLLSEYLLNDMRRLIFLASHNNRKNILCLLQSYLNADGALFKACEKCNLFIGKDQDEVDQHIKETHVFEFID